MRSVKLILQISTYSLKYTFNTFLPFYSIYVISRGKQSMLINSRFWYISTYADAYWFLYSTKEAIYSIRYL